MGKKDIDIDKLIMFLLYNIKGRKKKRDDWITIAEKCKIATDYFRSYKKLAEKLSVHPETIRSILKLLELPNEVKQIIKERKIGMDIAQRIVRIENPKDQVKAARIILDMSSHKARDIIKYIQRNPKSSKDIEKYKKKLLSSEEKSIKRMHMTIISFEEEIYDKLKKASSEKGISLSRFVTDLIKGCLHKNKK